MRRGNRWRGEVLVAREALERTVGFLRPRATGATQSHLMTWLRNEESRTGERAALDSPSGGPYGHSGARSVRRKDSDSPLNRQDSSSARDNVTGSDRGEQRLRDVTIAERFPARQHARSSLGVSASTPRGERCGSSSGEFSSAGACCARTALAGALVERTSHV